MVSRAPESECVAICRETNNQLLSWGSLALPVVHGIVLEQRNWKYTLLWNYIAFADAVMLHINCRCILAQF